VCVFQLKCEITFAIIVVMMNDDDSCSDLSVSNTDSLSHLILILNQIWKNKYNNYNEKIMFMTKSVKCMSSLVVW